MRSLSTNLTLPALVLVVLSLAPAMAPAATAPPAAPSPTLAPAWTMRLDGAVSWQRVAPLGQLLVETPNSLSAIDPVRGKVLWSRPDLGGIAEDKYEEIDGTSLVVLSDSMARPRLSIVDSIDGRVIFDSRSAGFRQVLSRHFLPQSKALLLFGFQGEGNATTMFLVDETSGTLRWKTDRLFEGQGKFTRGLTALLQAATHQSGIVGEPLEVTPDLFIVASGTEVFGVRTRTGDIAWRAPNAHGTRTTRFFATDKAAGLVFVGSETTMTMTSTSSGSEIVQSEYTALRTADGAAAWPKPVRIKGGLNDVIFADDGIILSPRTAGKGKILLCDYRSGESRWGKKGKGLEIIGGVINHDWTKACLVLTTGYDSAWTNKGTEYNLTLVDVTRGALRFEEPLRLHGRILATRVIPAGLLFITTSEVNVLDLRTGAGVLPEGIRSDDSLVSALSGRTLLAYAGRTGTLSRLDLDTTALTTLSRTEERLEEDDAPLAIETDGDRITVISHQNVIAWRSDGALLFHEYHPSPRLPAFQRVLLRAEQVRMGMAAATAGMAGAAFASASTATRPGSVERAVTATAATGYAQAGQQAAFMSARYGEAARMRFKATATAPDFVFMMVERGKGRHGLAKVSKQTGRIDAVIDLGRDKEPNYEVDAVSSLIFYRPTPDTVACYKF